MRVQEPAIQSFESAYGRLNEGAPMVCTGSEESAHEVAEKSAMNSFLDGYNRFDVLSFEELVELVYVKAFVAHNDGDHGYEFGHCFCCKLVLAYVVAPCFDRKPLLSPRIIDSY